MRGGTKVSARPEMNNVGTVTERIFRIDKYCNEMESMKKKLESYIK